jgi:predicted Rossmann fold flavoprotein
VPLVLDGASPHAAISGVAHDVELTLHDQRGAVSTRITGAMLWTHFGISGPAALDVSRHFLRHRLEGDSPALAVNFFPGQTFEAVERRWVEAIRARPRATLPTVMGEHLPASVAGALIGYLGLEPSRRLAALTREERRAIVHGLTRFPLPVRDSRGYNYAEATAGGVALDDIDPSTMRSRLCPGLYLVGEILDVDGRLGGFNFQWAWSSARTAGEGLARDVK